MKISNILSLLLITIFLEKGQQLPKLCQKDTNNELNCQTEQGNYSDFNSTDYQLSSLQDFKVITYNIDQNGQGGDSEKEQGIHQIINLFFNRTLEIPDVLFLQEIMRDCSSLIQNESFISGAEVIAQQLKMNYFYNVEYLYNSDEDNECTVGNAILSKHQFIQIEYTPFHSQCCDENIRKGKRGFQFASLNVSLNQQLVTLQLYNTHLESGLNQFLSVIQAYSTRVQSAQQILQKIHQDSLLFFNSQSKFLNHHNILQKLDPFITQFAQFLLKPSPYNNSYNKILQRQFRKIIQESNNKIELDKQNKGNLIQIFGGDLNSPLYDFDITVELIKFYDLKDAHYGMKYFDRNTCPYDSLSKYGMFIFDYLFFRSNLKLKINQKYVCQQCNGYSDHNPIGFTFQLI